MRYTLLTPVYNDGESLAELLTELDTLFAGVEAEVDVLIINDGGRPLEPFLVTAPQHIRRVEIAELVVNLGHQRAIAVGIAELARREAATAVIILDSDGEDKPADVLRLMAEADAHPQAVIVAQRRNRSESVAFRVFYRLYRVLFAVLTGERLDFGNFMLLPPEIVKAVAYNENLWNHLAATVLHSKHPIKKVPTDRGQRYKGRSTMNFEALVVHGLSAMSVYLTRIFTRTIIVLCILLGAAMVGIGVVVFIRLFTELAIPGWATNLVGILTIIILQLVLLLFGAIFATLNRRSTMSDIPLFVITQFINERKVIF